MVDGEATPAQIHDLRPHLRNCPGCRAHLKAMQDSAEPLQAVLSVPLVVAAAAAGSGSSEPASHIVLRAYEAMAGGLHERAVNGVTKAQAALEATSVGKVAAVAASAAAVAGGGGYVSTVERPGAEPVSAPRHPARVENERARVPSRSPVRSARLANAPNNSPRLKAKHVTEFGSQSNRSPNAPTEFGRSHQPRSQGTSAAQSPPSAASNHAPEFAATPASEFGR